jgi:hypothetical protein
MHGDGVDEGPGVDGHDEVEGEQGEVGEVVVVEGLTLEVRVNEPDPPEAPPPRPDTAEGGEVDGVGIAHHHVLHAAPTVDDDADLAPDVAGELGQLQGDLLGYDAARLQVAPVEPLERVDVAGLESRGVAVYLAGNGVTSAVG